MLLWGEFSPWHMGLCYSGPAGLQPKTWTGRLKAWGFRVAALGDGWSSFRLHFFPNPGLWAKAGLELSLLSAWPLSSWCSYGRGWRTLPLPGLPSLPPEGKVSALSVLLESSIVLKVLLGRGWRVTWETSQYLAYFMQEAFGVCCVGADAWGAPRAVRCARETS